jgi:hypothetical protein
MNENINQIVYQVVPEEYQGLAMTIIGLVGGAITLYFLLIQPLMNKSRTNTMLGEVQKENADLKAFIASNPTREEFEEMINQKMSATDKMVINSQILQLEGKLAFAQTDEARAKLQLQIDVMKASLV